MSVSVRAVCAPCIVLSPPSVRVCVRKRSVHTACMHALAMPFYSFYLGGGGQYRSLNVIVSCI